MRISTRIKLINNQIKALKNKKRILVESIKPMVLEPPRLTPPRAPEPPRVSSEQTAANKIYRWARRSGTNKLTLKLYLLMSDAIQCYVPEILPDHYDSGQFDDLYDEIWDIITYTQSETWEKLEAQIGPEDAFDKVLELVFKNFTKMQNIGDTEFGDFDYTDSFEKDEDSDALNDFWEEVATILRRMWDES